MHLGLRGHSVGLIGYTDWFDGVFFGCGNKTGQTASDSANQKKQNEQSDKVDFPLDKNGYPKSDRVVVNGKNYDLGRGGTKKQITIIRKKENKRVVILLPQGSSIYNWFLKENKEIRIISYKSMEIVSKNTPMREGDSGKVYRYELEMSDTDQIELKKTNVNEMGKDYYKNKAKVQLLIKLKEL